MSESPPQTTQLHLWLERIRGGDAAARDELLRQFSGRLELLARKMLRRFPNVHRWVETDDVLQGAMVRLLRSLQKVEPASVLEFLGLASLEMRRELLDLARHYCGPRGIGANHATKGPGEDDSRNGFQPAAQVDDPDDLERWQAFHEGVERLPAEEREVVGLIYYHGYTQLEVAELLHMSERTVRRRWESAMVWLHSRLKGPEPTA